MNLQASSYNTLTGYTHEAKMTLSAGQRSQLQADLAEARTLLKVTSRQCSERLERVAAEKETELNTAQSRLADANR